MSKDLGYFFLCIVFILGVSIGLYAGIDMNKENSIASNTTVNEPVQDVVIKTIQKENREDNIDSGEAIEVAVSEERVSPYSKLIVKKVFSKCSHTTVDIIDMPKELINLTKKEFQEKYSGWQIEKFADDEIILLGTINGNCEDHFVLKENEGTIAIYNELTEDKMNLLKTLDVNVELLTNDDKMSLKEGIKVYGKQELNSIIEDYTS